MPEGRRRQGQRLLLHRRPRAGPGLRPRGRRRRGQVRRHPRQVRPAADVGDEPAPRSGSSGVARARELVYTARTFTGVEAAAWGLAVRSVPRRRARRRGRRAGRDDRWPTAPARSPPTRTSTGAALDFDLVGRPGLRGHVRRTRSPTPRSGSPTSADLGRRSGLLRDLAPGEVLVDADVAGKAEHALAEDVAHDLRRAALDGVGAGAEEPAGAGLLMASLLRVIG